MHTQRELFRAFCVDNGFEKWQEALETFILFGGMGWRVDKTQTLQALLTTKVLENYRYLHGDITKLTQSDTVRHKLLTALSQGDGKAYTAFKHANVGRSEGERLLDELEESGLIRFEESILRPPNEEEVSPKYSVTLPFIQFWFALVSPYYKGIKEGNYEEFFTQLQNRFAHLEERVLKTLISEQLALDLGAKKWGAYWDSATEIDFVAKVDEKVVVAAFSFGKKKLNKSAITNLEAKCALADIKPDIILLYSHNGFSSELKKLKGESLRLLRATFLDKVVENLSKKDSIATTFKKY